MAIPEASVTDDDWSFDRPCETLQNEVRAGHRNPSIRFYGTLRTVPVTVPSVFWQAFYTVQVMVRAGPIDPVNNMAVDGTTTVDGSRVPHDNVYPALID